MNGVIEARCHCGKVHISMPASAAGIIACHCGVCQKLHGNFNAFFAAAITDVALEGADALTWYQSSRESRRAFCSTCGSRVLKEVTNAGRWLVSAGLVDGPSGRHIVKNLWEQSKPDWYALPESKP